MNHAKITSSKVCSDSHLLDKEFIEKFVLTELARELK